MGFINCCGKNVYADVFELIPVTGSVWAVLRDMHDVCPHCGHFKIQIDKITIDGEFKSIVYENAKAFKLRRKLFDSCSVRRRIVHKEDVAGSAFYLYYSEYGKKKKCYSNLSTLKMGMFDSLDLKAQKDLIAV